MLACAVIVSFEKFCKFQFCGQEAQSLHSQGVLCICKRRFPSTLGSVDKSIDKHFQYELLLDIQHWDSVAV